MKKPQLTIRLTLLIIVGVLNVLIAVLVGKDVYESWVHYKQAQSLNQATVIINVLYVANKNLSLERASSLSLLYALPGTAETLKEDVEKNRVDTDAVLASALSALKKQNVFEVNAALIAIENKYELLKLRRIMLDKMLALPVAKRDMEMSSRFFESSTALITEIQNFMLIYVRAYQGIDSSISRQMMFKYFVWELAEYSGEEYAIIGGLIADDKHPTPDQQEQLLSLRGHIQYGWEILRKFSANDELAEKLLPLVEEAQTHYFFTFDQTKELFFSNSSGTTNAAYPISIEMWLGMATQAIDSLLVLQEKILKETQLRVDAIEANAKKEIIISAFIFFCAFALSIYSWGVVVFRVARPINAMVDALYRATQENIFEVPKIVYKHDEIGKLASVLEAFQKNVDKMKESNEELERFAFIAAHDLKSPLRAVDNISQWLEEDLEDILSEKNKQYMVELRKRVQLMDKLLDDTLEYARIDAKMESITNDIIGGHILMNEVEALLNIPDGFTFIVNQRVKDIQLSRFPVQQVLYNLANNAFKHHDKQRGIVEVDVDESEKLFTFFVKDDGPGIEPRYHQKIFEMFQTLQPRETSKGRGMGLAIVRKIIMNNGGGITVESDLGKGTVFRFTWLKSGPKTTGEE